MSSTGTLYLPKSKHPKLKARFGCSRLILDGKKNPIELGPCGANVAVVPGGVLAAVDADARLGVALFRAAVALALFGLSHQVQQDLARDEVLTVPSVEPSPGVLEVNSIEKSLN